MNSKVWISALCSFLLSLGLLHSTKALQPWESKPWLSLYAPRQRLRLPDTLNMNLEGALENSAPVDILGNSMEDYDANSREAFLPLDEDKTEEDSEPHNDYLDAPNSGKPFSESVAKRHKRVFLSRGWMAGGYKAPSPSPNRFVRRPPALVPSPAHFTQPKTGGGTGGGAHYAALVSDQPQQSPPFRRFHSIFTSGMWTPLGKRSLGGLVLQPQNYY